MNLKPTEGRIIIRANRDKKNYYRLTDDVTIRLVKGVENYNRRETEPVQAIVLSGGNVPVNSEILVSHNSLHPTNEIFDHDYELHKDDVLYSLPVEEAYVYREEGSTEWKPNVGFLIVEKIFEPYKGFITGIAPQELVNRLFCIQGEHQHKALLTENHCFYTILFMGLNGREQAISRMKNNDFELVGVLHDLTDRVLNGELLIGETAESALTFKEYMDARTKSN